MAARRRTAGRERKAPTSAPTPEVAVVGAVGPEDVRATDAVDAQVWQLRQAGATWREIARMVNRAPETCRRRWLQMLAAEVPSIEVDQIRKLELVRLEAAMLVAMSLMRSASEPSMVRLAAARTVERLSRSIRSMTGADMPPALEIGDTGASVAAEVEAFLRSIADTANGA